jgi:protein required for attachment to host cells
MTRRKIWALVTNGVRARVVRGLENGDSLDPIEFASKASSTHLRDIMADQAGRSFSSDASGRRSAMEPGSDPVLRDMQDFATETLEFLERHRRAGDFDRLVVVAAPRMLGVVRQEMPSGLKDAVMLEHSANLVQLDEAELRARMREMVKQEGAR